MAQVTAGEIVTFRVGDATITAKVEDASKSESILAKVESSTADNYRPEQVYEFERSWLEVG